MSKSSSTKQALEFETLNRTMITAKITLSILFLTFAVLLLAACSPQAQMPGHNHPMTPLAEMPEMVVETEAVVQEAYQFTVANPDVASQIACYCGCVGMGHKSSYDCYLSRTDANGELTFDNHAIYCRVCVDITQDTMRLLDEGKSISEISSYIDANYVQFGPPTINN